jgi:type II secretory ATPase GspE/PulE/Tfp pilus assembly ATPase PilB-like protein
LLTMKPDALDREMTSRNINRDALSDFMEKWLAWWPDPEKWQAAFKWRVWLYEMLEFDDEIKQLLLEWEKALAVEKYALQEKWMVNLERDGVFKLMQGKISIEEVYRLVKHKKY